MKCRGCKYFDRFRFDHSHDTGELFDNARIAAEAKGTLPQHICHCCICYEGRKQAGGFRWAYWEPKTIIKKAFDVGYKAYSKFEKEDDKTLWIANILNWLENQGFYFRLNSFGSSVEINFDCIYEEVCLPRQEATLAAIDAALDYLSKNKK